MGNGLTQLAIRSIVLNKFDMVNIFISKQRAIFIIVVLLTILILISLLFFKQNPKESPEVSSSSKPKQITKQNLPLQIVGASLKGEYLGWTEPLEIVFSEPTTFANVDIEITPETNFNLSNDLSGYKVIINPTDSWIFNSNYTVTIKKASSKKGNYLDQAYVYNFKTYNYSGL